MMTPIHCEEYTAFSSLSFHWKTNDAMSSPCDINISDYSQEKSNAWLCVVGLSVHICVIRERLVIMLMLVINDPEIFKII